jgi:hypothetical protein
MKTTHAEGTPCDALLFHEQLFDAKPLCIKAAVSHESAVGRRIARVHAVNFFLAGTLVSCLRHNWEIDIAGSGAKTRTKTPTTLSR